MESLSLMKVCLKQVRGIDKNTRVVDSNWIWTEPHSKRIKICIEIEQGILDNKSTIRQKVIVEFIVRNKQCLDCIREATDHTWGVLIQVRHRVGHKKSLYQLENLLSKKGLYNFIMQIDISKEGLDMYFKKQKYSDRVLNFITSTMPTKTKVSRKLLSQDKHSNTTKYEYTVNVEIVPLCKGDLVLLPHNYGHGADLMIVSKLASSIHLISPITLNSIVVNSTKYFKSPFTAIMSFSHLSNFVILDIVKLTEIHRDDTGDRNSLAEAEVVKENDFGVQFHIITHLGNVLLPGDTCVGYDLKASLNDENILLNLPFAPPDVILLRKSYDPDTKVKKKKKSNNNPVDLIGETTSNFDTAEISSALTPDENEGIENAGGNSDVELFDFDTDIQEFEFDANNDGGEDNVDVEVGI